LFPEDERFYEGWRMSSVCDERVGCSPSVDETEKLGRTARESHLLLEAHDKRDCCVHST